MARNLSLHLPRELNCEDTDPIFPLCAVSIGTGIRMESDVSNFAAWCGSGLFNKVRGLRKRANTVEVLYGWYAPA